MDSNWLKRQFSKTDIVFFLCCLAVLALQLWKATRGFGSSDEHFYITLGYRIAQGDAMFYDDWHIAQIISVFLAPLVWLHRLLRGNNTGIVLAFRQFYILYNLIITVCIYIHFRKSGAGSVFAALIYMLFTPFNIMALSYNTMGPGFLILAALVFPFEQEHSLRALLSGVFYAFAVLNNPYLVGVYAILVVLTLRKQKPFTARTFWLITAGITCIALAFLCFVFSRASIAQILSCLNCLIDPSHQNGMFYQLAYSFWGLLKSYQIFFILLFCSLPVSVWMKRKRASEEHKNQYFAGICVVSILAILYRCLFNSYELSLGGYMVILFPFSLLGLNFMILFQTESDQRFCFLLSLLNSLAVACSSNVGARTLSAPLVFSCSITALWLLKENRKPASRAVLAVFILLLVYYKASFVYIGSGDYTSQATDGPLAGLYDSAESRKQYEEKLEDIRYLNEQPENYANLITSSSWTYLALEKRFNTNSTYLYLWYKEEYIAAIEKYYQIHAGKTPSLIYLDTDDNLYGIREGDMLLEGLTKVNQLNCGILYRKSR